MKNDIKRASFWINEIDDALKDNESDYSLDEMRNSFGERGDDQ